MTAPDAVTDGGEVYVFADQSVVQTEHLRILFDALVQSMDFGSGFLDTEEVEALRSIAEDLGVNPMVATPSAFRTQYGHDFEAMDVPKRWGHMTDTEYASRCAWAAAICRHCNRKADEAPHPYEEVSA